MQMGMDRKAWLEERKKGIGGSDVAGIMGLSKWETPLSIYLKKKGLFPEQLETQYEDEGFDPLYWGTVLEDVVSNKFQEVTGLKCHRVNQILIHPKHEFIRASIDRRIVSNREGLECKTSNAFKSKDWDDKIPNDYMLQCQHYLAVTGYKAWHLAVLIGGNTFKRFIIERDDELIEQIKNACINFWKNHVLKDCPPEANLNDSKLLDVLYNDDIKIRNATEDSLDLSSHEQLINDIQKLKSSIKELKKIQSEKEIEIKKLMKEDSLAQTNNYIITWSLGQRNYFDSKKLKLDNYDIYSAYLKTTETRTLKIKEKK